VLSPLSDISSELNGPHNRPEVVLTLCGKLNMTMACSPLSSGPYGATNQPDARAPHAENSGTNRLVQANKPFQKYFPDPAAGCGSPARSQGGDRLPADWVRQGDPALARSQEGDGSEAVLAALCLAAQRAARLVDDGRQRDGDHGQGHLRAHLRATGSSHFFNAPSCPDVRCGAADHAVQAGNFCPLARCW